MSTCPACGSGHVSVSIERERYCPPYGEPVSYDVHQDTCDNCGMVGDFEDVNSGRIEKEHSEADRKSVEPMIQYLKEQGLRMVYIERVLGVPFGSIELLGRSGPSKYEIALIRLLCMFPEIIHKMDERMSIMRITSLGSLKVRELHGQNDN